MSDEFYIGYERAMPSSFARMIRRAVLLVAVLAVAVPTLLLYAQTRFGGGLFEYGTIRRFEGAVVERPYPLLDTGDALVLLVAPFKFGAAAIVGGLDGHRVRLEGTLIERDGLRMIEVRPGSVDAIGISGSRQQLQTAGRAVVRGEIVDPKCYLGVMKPAMQQVHRDCAVRCLSGGIPPMLVSSAPGDSPQRLLLIRHDGTPLRASLERLVGRPLVVAGIAMTMKNLRFLAVEGLD